MRPGGIPPPPRRRNALSGPVIVRRSVINGRASGVATILGNEAGVLPWGLAAAFGLSGLLLASRAAYDTMRITGAVLLVSGRK